MIKYEYNFLAGIHFQGSLVFNNFKLSLLMYTSSDSEDIQNTAFERMHYTIHEIVGNSVFVDETDADTILNLNNANIPVLPIPHPGPYDQMIQMALMSKLNAIMEEYLVITDCEITSEKGNVTYTYSIEEQLEHIDLLPDTGDQWWNSATTDFGISYNNESWDDLSMGWYEDNDDNNDTNTTPEPIIEPSTDNDNIIDFNKKK